MLISTKVIQQVINRHSELINTENKKKLQRYRRYKIARIRTSLELKEKYLGYLTRYFLRGIIMLMKQKGYALRLSKGFGAIYILIGVVVIAAITGIIYFGKLPISQTQTSVPPTPQLESVSGNLTFKSTDKKFSFEYPSDLYAVERTPNQVLIYLNKKEAMDGENCIKERKGTLASPCGDKSLVFNISYSIQESATEQPDLMNPKTFTDNAGNVWIVDDLIEVAGALNLSGFRKEGASLITGSIQIAIIGFSNYEFKGKEVNLVEISKEAEKLAKEILSTFKFN